MINANGEIVVDQTTSYTTEEAVLVLLGIKLSDEAEYDKISLDVILDAEKEGAEADYLNAKAEKLSDESIKAAFDNLTKTDQLITKAAQYRRDIIDELAKKESALRQDKSNRITTNSFNRWALDTFKISIFDELGDDSPVKPVPKMRAQEEAILDAIRKLGYVPKNFPKNPSGKLGAKDDVRQLIQHDPLFTTTNIFESAWERLRKEKSITDMK
jgi:hypothetical protein